MGVSGKREDWERKGFCDSVERKERNSGVAEVLYIISPIKKSDGPSANDVYLCPRTTAVRRLFNKENLQNLNFMSYSKLIEKAIYCIASIENNSFKIVSATGKLRLRELYKPLHTIHCPVKLSSERM